MALLTLFSDMVQGFDDIFSAFSMDPSVLWLIIPLFLMWFLFVIYFGKHKSEQLGWNSALGNGVTLMWVTFMCFREVYTVAPADRLLKFYVLTVVLIYSLFIIWTSLGHKMHPKIAFAFASPTFTYFLGAVVVLFSFGVLRIHWIIAIDLVIMLIAVLLLQGLVRRFIKGTEEVVHDAIKEL